MPLPEYSHITTASLEDDELELGAELEVGKELEDKLKLELDNELELELG